MSIILNQISGYASSYWLSKGLTVRVLPAVIFIATVMFVQPLWYNTQYYNTMELVI